MGQSLVKNYVRIVFSTKNQKLLIYESYEQELHSYLGGVGEFFYWQDGYGAFSVNSSELDTVVKYINNQHTHHNKRTYQEEYRAFLKKYKVEYDERYVWE